MNQTAKIRLDEALRAALPGVVGSCVHSTDPNHGGWAGPTSWRAKGGEMVRVDWSSTPSQADETAAYAVIDGFDSSDAGQAAVDLQLLRQGGEAVFADANATKLPLALAARGFALVSLDEFNALRTWTRDLKAAVAGAGTLAQLKTAVAALPTLADRTAAQIKPAVRGKISAGNAD